MRVAVCQLHAGRDDVEANVAAAEELLREAAAGGAGLAALPELFPYYGSQRRMRELAEPIPGPTTERLSAIARDSSMWVLGGSLCEAVDERVHNTSPLFNRAGELVASYRKIHLYDVDLPDQRPIRESALFTPGTELITHETEEVRLGLTVCYDLRFPELYRGLMTLGAQVLLVPSAFQALTGEAHWEVLLRARAIEDQCFVVAAAQWGPWGPPDAGHRCYGHSMVVDPWGRILIEAPGDGDGVFFADLDMGELRRVRGALPALSHRRLGMVC
jgi:predicted amidohydrolase